MARSRPETQTAGAKAMSPFLHTSSPLPVLPMPQEDMESGSVWLRVQLSTRVWTLGLLLLG